MNGSIMRVAIGEIEQCQAALEWLETYGRNLTGRSDDDNAFVTIHLNFAGSCTGAKEATKLMEAYGRSLFPEIVEATIRGCKNTVEIRREQLLKEIGA
jgi:hypothetical protein